MAKCSGRKDAQEQWTARDGLMRQAQGCAGAAKKFRIKIAECKIENE
jgi:hypothetical protein